ncbi:MAG: YbaB/EbfC family nucleoid-associated protein [Firmicutes bacterium]|nr:YbaB/EbfC family nucleoid-associated protein [Bacillota bacterium]
MAAFDMNRIMRQAQKLQSEIERVRREVAEKTVEATAGGGKVRAKVSGEKELVELVIDPEVVDPADVEMLQDLVIAAVNEAYRMADEMVAAEMGKVAGAFGLPVMPGLLPGRG